MGAQPRVSNQIPIIAMSHHVSEMLSKKQNSPKKEILYYFERKPSVAGLFFFFSYIPFKNILP